MENNFYRTINIVEDWIPRFSQFIDWSTITPEQGRPPYERHFHNIDEIMPKYIVERLRDVGLSVRMARIFSWPKDYKCIWHVDGRRFTENTAVNFILFGGGTMQWATDDMQIIKRPYSDTWAGIRDFEAPNQTVAEECEMDKGLFNICIPHRVVTPPEGRITLSLLWKQECNYPFLEMVERFKDAGFIDE
jgi:hypothetical protein